MNLQKKLKISLIFLNLLIFLFSLIFLFQINLLAKDENRFISISDQWHYNFYSCNKIDFSDPKFIKSGITDLPINFSKLIEDYSKKVPKGIVEFTKAISINYPLFEDSKFIGIYLGKLVDCNEIYIDGNLVSINGIYKNNFFTSWNKNVLVKIPNIINKGIKEVEIKIKVYYFPEGSIQDVFLLGDYDKLKKIERMNNLVDIDLKIVLLIVSILFSIIFFYIGSKLKTKYYIIFSLLIVQICLFTIIYIINDLPLNHDLFNYLFEYKSIYLSSILLILFVMEYIKRKPDKVMQVSILIAGIGFIFDTLIYNRILRLSIYQLFNFILYLSLVYLVGFVFFGYLKTRSKNYMDMLIPILLLFISLTNDFVAFKYPNLIKKIYPQYMSLKYLNIYGFQVFIFLIAIRLVKDLVNSFYRLRNMTYALDKISIELENRKEMLASNVQKILDETKESFLISEKLTESGNEFSKLIFNLVNKLDDMKESLLLSSKNEENITEKTEQLTKMLENVEDGFKKTSKILEIVIEKINNIIENTNQIDTIVEQTSILSLNSSVVAGKAKEKGKGFSIISDEIRKLALKSADFSSNAHNGIDNILKSVEETKIRSNEFMNVFNKYLSQFEILKEKLIKNKENHLIFENKITEIIQIIENISLLANEIDEKARQLFAISNENMNVKFDI